MDAGQLKLQREKLSKKENSLTLQVVNLPSKTQLLLMPSPSTDFRLYHYGKKKINLAVFSTQIPQTKLFHNLELYEWRRQTDFPIVKTRYVSIKSKTPYSSEKVQIQVFLEHCPFRLSGIYEIPLPQTLYLIKECLIGFERLFNRFGGFEITQTMIAINQKGFCRVWITQNFHLNAFNKEDSKEFQMLHIIMNLIQSHCVEAKNSIRLFRALKKCSTFLQALKMIDAFVITEKILVPSKFSLNNWTRRQSKKQTNNRFLKSTQSQEKSKRLLKKYPMTPFRHFHNSKSKESSNEKHSKVFPSFQLKRIKSQEKVAKFYNMKISAGETACSINNKDIKNSNFFQFRQAFFQQSTKSNKSEKKKYKKWRQNSSFVQELSQTKKTLLERQKRQLTQSQSVLNQPFKFKDRKYSGKFMSSNPQLPTSKFKLKNYDLGKEEVSHLIQDQEITKIIPEYQQEKTVEHSYKIIEENGWKNNAAQLFEIENSLKKSIHTGGQEQNLSLKQIKLEKLGCLIRRKEAMSILPQQCPQDYQ